MLSELIWSQLGIIVIITYFARCPLQIDELEFEAPSWDSGVPHSRLLIVC